MSRFTDWLQSMMQSEEGTQEDGSAGFQMSPQLALTGLELSLDGIVVVDGNQQVLYANRACERIFGWSRDDLVGGPVGKVLPDGLDQEHSISNYRMTAHDDVLGIEWQTDGLHKDGQRFPVELTDVVMTNHGETVHMYQLRDISDRIKHEEKMKKVNSVLAGLRDQALEASKAKSTFLANMSHELRTPLNAILGYSEMLREELEDMGHQDLVGDLLKVHAAGKHLLALINSILDLSKIEAGKMELYMEAVEVPALLHEVEEMARPLAEQNGNQLTFHIPPEVGRMVADITKLRQVLLNIISNACKFTTDGAVTVIARRYKPVDADWIEVQVADTGIGMTPEQRERLFEEFTQADASTTRKFGGTGLGLAISRRFCRMMGGDITVDSSHGQGSTFVIRLPANTIADAGGDQVPSDATGNHVRVLVIDDDASVRELLARTLAKEDMVVATAGSGQQGIERARVFQPDIITLDVMMPEMDGWSVLAALKNEPSVAHVPVVMVSMVDERRMGYALGAAAYLTKPIDRTELVQTLQRFRHSDTPQRVLLVEDQPEVRDLVRRTMEGDGWSVLEAGNGVDALRILSEQTPSVILLDLMMPEMDGFQFIEELDKNEGWAEIPVIVITAMDLSNTQREQLERRVERILHKGVYTREELLDMVRAKVSVHGIRSARQNREKADKS